ncbi:M14 family zinc carboxypeptidase [Egicoccus halophilus]|uniref:Peptidase M14 domain-containing protein n=1 Tax=Egicoccus halophilus TaxID=1670830 RepID=A0A8J3A6L0_9ACTN|nr:M14 family zinc carboxypeptidase [Egicoccus halophilus]GGI04435.1 hypothetical protein GCM10011354_09080 [Egicoccus halophilus]
MLAAVAVPTPATANPGTAHCGTETGGTSVAGFIDHTELGRQLERLERSSQGRVAVDLAGHSFEGREIWTATVGHGDQVVLVTTEIHGNEKQGTTALLNLLGTLGNNSRRSAEIREQVTFVAVPKLNPDGAELDQRRNGLSWSDALSMHPQLEGGSPVWYYNASQNGFDVNRDFHPDVSYEPQLADLPADPDGFGMYVTPEARTLRDVYAGLEEQHGRVDVYVDLHNQGPCFRYGTPTEVEDDHYSYLSLTATLMDEERWGPSWPTLDFDASRRANVAVYDALQRGNSPASKVTMYPQHFDDPSTAHGSFALRGSAVVLFETAGQTQHIGQKRMGMLVRQIENGVQGILDALTDGTFDDIDPERYDDIPARASAASMSH